jgi:hypothetical protein
MGNGELDHYVPPGSLHDQLGLRHVPLTRSRSETTASHSNARQFAEFGAGNIPSATNRPGVRTNAEPERLQRRPARSGQPVP